MNEEPLHANATEVFEVTFGTDGEAATARLAARIAAVVERGDVLALDGPLGAGKTVFARGFIRALTGPEEEVPSPTFTLVQIYESAAGPIHHFDLYRIETAGELLELGIEEAFADGITLIEWPERARSLENERWLTVVFAIDSGKARAAEARSIALRPGAAWRERLRTLELTDAEPGHGCA